MSTPNPMSTSSSLSISQKQIHIAGINVTIHGVTELSPQATKIHILWLLHPRLQTSSSMTSTAAHILHAYNTHPHAPSRGLIAISFDQRNHGSRLVSPLANEAWKQGNPQHAPDMWGIFAGTAQDVGLVMGLVGGYLFPGGEREVVERGHLTLGVSLGGHASWLCWVGERRVMGSVVVIGCPDYMDLMTNRARLSKLPSYTQNPSSFLGSPSFPPSLISTIRSHDPKALLFSTSPIPTSPPSLAAQSTLRATLDARIRNKSLLLCSGGADKLVPYASTEKFSRFLKDATGKGGWYEDGGVYVEDLVYEGVGHEFSAGMLEDATRFICNLVEGRSPGAKEGEARL